MYDAFTGPAAEQAWSDFQHQAATGIAAGRRAGLPETDPRHTPQTDGDNR